MQVFTSKQFNSTNSTQFKYTNTTQNNYPDYATHGNTYTVLFYPRQAPSHKHLHKNHKRKEKGSCDFPLRGVPVGPLVRAESWQKGARSVSSAPYRDYGLIAFGACSLAWVVVGEVAS